MDDSGGLHTGRFALGSPEATRAPHQKIEMLLARSCTATIDALRALIFKALVITA